MLIKRVKSYILDSDNHRHKKKMSNMWPTSGRSPQPWYVNTGHVICTLNDVDLKDLAI